nr:cell wall protein RTB1-like [Labrus bergylta]
MNFTTTNSSTLTPTPTMTGTEGGETTQDGKTSSPEMPTPKPGYTDKSPTPTMEDNNKDKGKTTDEKKNDSTGIVILIIIIIIVLGFGVVCFFARKRGRRYSVDFTSRPDDANIPLSIVDPELPINTVPQNGLQTFESVESTKEPQEPETKPEAQEEQKVDPDKSVVEPAAESAAPAPAPDSPEDKPKEEGVETTPPAPVEPSVDEKTDDEGVVSNKTSVESLKETNENNSNSADFRQKPDLMSSNSFCDVPLDCPV